MAAGMDTKAVATVANDSRVSYTGPLILMVSLYFGIGFITSLNDILVAHFKDLFHLKNFQAQMVQMAFFGAYFVMSLPSGWIVAKIGYKYGIVVSLATMGMGLLLFVPASMIIFYPLFLFALFVVGSGLALLQVAINPYVVALGKPETGAARQNLVGFFNSLATTIAPKIGAAVIFVAAGATAVELARSVRGPYVTLAGCAFGMALLVLFVRLPDLIEKSETREGGYAAALGFRNLRLGAVAIFCYVGAEVAIGSIMINFLGQPQMGGMSHEAAAEYVSLYWRAAMVGRLIGIFVQQKVRAERALAFVTVLAALLVITVMTTHGAVAMWAAVGCGLFNSVMWPCIFPLGVKGLGRYTSQGSGILVMMVVGGAVIPVIQGLLADAVGFQWSFAVVLACYLYLVFYAVNGYKNRHALPVGEASV